MLALRNNVQVKVFYTWSQLQHGKKFDPGFGKTIEWDIPLLDGYEHSFVENISTKPGSDHFTGINNPTLNREIKTWGADALLVYGWSFKSHFKAMRFFKNKIPVLFRGDSTLLDEKPGLKKIVRRAFLKYVYSFADTAFYAGEANKKYFAAHGFKEKQLVFMPHAIDNRRFAPSDENKIAAHNIRQQLKIPNDGLLFLFAAKMDKNKNAILLVESFLDCNNEKSHLLIVGNGSEEQNIKSKCEGKENVHFLNFQNQQNMPGLYACANVFVLPSKSETWGLAVNEAMAAGKAIVLSDTCGAAFDLVTSMENGFVFKNNDKEDLKKAIQYFIDNKSESERMGNCSRKKIQMYSYEKDCEAIETFMQQIEREEI